MIEVTERSYQVTKLTLRFPSFVLENRSGGKQFGYSFVELRTGVDYKTHYVGVRASYFHVGKNGKVNNRARAYEDCSVDGLAIATAALKIAGMYEQAAIVREALICEGKPYCPGPDVAAAKADERIAKIKLLMEEAAKRL